MTSELEVTPNTPPDWRDWINEFPSIKSVALFCVLAWIISAAIIAYAGLWGYFTDHEPKAGIIRALEIWLDSLNWLTAAAVFGVVGKRATEKADVVRAEGEVKAKTIVAAAQAQAMSPQPVGAPHPNTDPTIVAAVEAGAILQEEARLKQERQSVVPMEDA